MKGAGGERVRERGAASPIFNFHCLVAVAIVGNEFAGIVRDRPEDSE